MCSTIITYICTYVDITGTRITRPYERKRPKKERPTIQTSTTTFKKEVPKKPAVSQNLIAGEDITSFERHNRLLALEYSNQRAKGVGRREGVSMGSGDPLLNSVHTA